MRQDKLWTRFFPAIALAMATGCGAPVAPFEPGSVELWWDVAPLGCAESGVEQVIARLANGSEERERRLRCGQHHLVFADVEPGTYTLTMTAFDEAGQAAFEMVRTDLFVRPDERRDLGLVDLVARTSTAEVGWYFENQRLCGANGVEVVELTVFDVAYYEVFRSSTGCDAGSLTVEGLKAGPYLFRMRAESENMRYEGVSEHVLKRGGMATVEVTLLSVSE